MKVLCIHKKKEDSIHVKIWQDEKDEFCEVLREDGTREGLSVLKLQKIVFAGFVKDKKDKK